MPVNTETQVTPEDLAKSLSRLTPHELAVVHLLARALDELQEHQ
jgi:hypothetical protein